MIRSAATLRLHALHSSRLRTLILAVCGLFLLSFAAPRSQAVFADSTTASAASAQNSSAASQVERQKELQQKNIDNPEAEDAVNVYRHSATVHKLARVFGISVEVMSRWLEVLNFLVVLAFIIWFVSRILPKTLRARTERIQSQLQQARTVTEDANRRLASVEERLSRLDAEIDTIKTRAEHETLLEEKRLHEALEQEKQSILDFAAQEIAAAGNNAQNQLKRLTAELAIEHAKHKIAVTPATDRSLVESFLVDLDKERRSGVN
jgi:F-type H+-transporting ATPase subunit b